MMSVHVFVIRSYVMAVLMTAHFPKINIFKNSYRFLMLFALQNDFLTLMVCIYIFA